MLRVALFTRLVLALAPAFAVQVPLDSRGRWQDQQSSAILGNIDHTEWSFGTFPNPNATDHLVFETVYSLLQRWPNTRMRNGHNIVPGIIPKGTLLYHGTDRKELPPGPEWVAMEPEHSYVFCRDGSWLNHLQRGCWHLTLATTRPLKVVYFDGSSAAKFPYGPLDTQDLIAWGETPPDSEWDEIERIEDLCKWGKSFGVDGIVRMSVDFEVMLCDFTSSVSMVFANLAHPLASPSVTIDFLLFQPVISGSWHNRFPGETRVQLDLTGLVSFYDTELVPSLVPIRAGQERWDHRVQNTSSEDISVVKSRLEAALIRPPGSSSGIDWKTVIQVVVDQFAQRLELVRHLMNSPATNPDELLDLANKTQAQLRLMLTPYILSSVTPADPIDKHDLDWAIPTYKFCATMHIYSTESGLDYMTDSEKFLLQAIRGTTREICRVVTKMWAAGVHAGVDRWFDKQSPDAAGVTQVWSSWAEDLHQLMAWLDWSVWVKCNPDCSPEEICYLPSWPFGFPNSPLGNTQSYADIPQEKLTSFNLQRMILGRQAEQAGNSIKPGPNEWIRPQPKCIRFVDTYEF